MKNRFIVRVLIHWDVVCDATALNIEKSKSARIDHDQLRTKLTLWRAPSSWP